MNKLQEEFKSGMYRIGNFVVHIITNPITTLEGIRLNWDSLQHPTEIKVFLSGLIGLMVFAAMPDDVIRNGVDSFNKKFRKNVSDTPIVEVPVQPIQEEMPQEIIEEPIPEIIATIDVAETPQNYATESISLSKPRTYQPNRFRPKGT